MAASVLPSQTIRGVEDPAEQPSLTYRLDLKARRVLGMVDGVEAVRQAAMLALLTPRFKCLIFDNQYGSELCNVITDTEMTEELARTEIDRYVREALSRDPRIVAVTSIEPEFEGENVIVRVGLTTTFGDTDVEVIA